ncbi:MAG: zinc ribbon domain-containing protein [Candidatus Manganitrophus sp.]|nr:MAG: zinc ribbon domain-containing protein [Candidatus Manganitrophus sp.]WDT74467.1 MAG: zinc ribbon domain-containing protein [Candidatus Manganitrophus sp.]WDT79110.1 MAG: zinc ribbon domain-containing protein [Candidatus Manganitrophus sp.]
MKCPQCHTENKGHRSFCRQCGIQILVHCPQCGFGNEMTADFYCGGCGRKLSSALHTDPGTDNQSVRTASSKPSSSITIADLLRDDFPETQMEKKEEKRIMTQEEINKLFNL